MKLSEVKSHYKEMIAYQAMIETAFKIPADDLYVRHRQIPGGYMLQVIARQGTLDFVIDVAVVATNLDEFQREWGEVVVAHNAAPKNERAAVLEASQARVRLGEMVSAMVLKGFRG